MSFFKDNKRDSYCNRDIQAYLLYGGGMGKGVEENKYPEQQDNESVSKARYTCSAWLQPMGKHTCHGVSKVESIKIP